MKVALVTGAYKGLGYAWCKALSERDYTVLLTARNAAQAEEAAATLRSEGLDVHGHTLDVTDEPQLAALAHHVQSAYGRLDLLVNNAGVNPKDRSDKAQMAKAFYLDHLDAGAMLEVLHINSLAPLLTVKHFRALLRSSGNGMVINISSWLGSVNNISFGGHYGYVGSKNLLNTLNRSMAYELRPDNIISINVNPGWVQTDMGGRKAVFTAEEAVNNLLTLVADRATIDDSGKFFNYDGTEHPW